MSDQSVGTPAQERARRLEQLRERSHQPFPESWRHEQDPEIAGEFVRLEHGPTPFGVKPIAILRLESGEERSVWMLNEVLRNQFAGAAPQPGDLVCVRWLGPRKSKGGSEYNDYRVTVDPIAGGPNWSAVATGADVAELEEASRSFEHLPTPPGQPPIPEERAS